MNHLSHNRSMLRIAVIDDQKLDTLRYVQMAGRKFVKGFMKNGHDVMPISYRNLMLQFSPIKSKTIARKWGKPKADDFCVQLLANYSPDIIFITAFKNYDSVTVDMLRDALPNTFITAWIGDSLDRTRQSEIDILKRFDLTMYSGGGHYLEELSNTINKRCAFIPNPSDPDVERPYLADNPTTDLFFSGKLYHRSRGNDKSRKELIESLASSHNMKVFGCLNQPSIFGIEYFKEISKSKIALSVNASNDIYMYHSDRLINYISCGPMVISKQVPGSELLFRDNEHIRYFTDEKECVELVEYYLKHDKERKKIAQAGMIHAHTEFHYQRITKDIIDLIQTGHYDAPWENIYN